MEPVALYFLLSLQTLVVGGSQELNLTVSVWNEGEDSYGTSINFYYPAGLSYRRVSRTRVSKSPWAPAGRELSPALGYSRFLLILL